VIQSIDEAVDGLATFFDPRQTRAGVVARRLLGIAHADDERLADHLIRERRSATRLDGSIDGSLQATAWSAWELLRLGCTRGHTGLDRMVGFLVSRQDQPGRFGEGCSQRRHEIGTCNHFVSGFFSPGSRDDAIAPLVLPTQAVIVSEIAARFAVSCFALRTVLFAGEDRRDAVRRHVESLLVLAERWRNRETEFPNTIDVMFCAQGALGLSPPEYAERAQRLTERIAEMQSADGSWEGTSLFHAVEGLLNVRNEPARAAIARAIPRLLAGQLPSGAFDPSEDEELALIALRAIRTQGPGLRAVTRSRQSEA
jgi:hypothetical protein